MSGLLSGTPRQHVKRWSAAEIIDAPRPKDPFWIGPSVLPKGGLLLFGGPSKIGKSMIMLSLCRDLATGRPHPMGCPFLSINRPVRVLCVEQELKFLGTKDRLELMYKHPDKSTRDLLHENLQFVTGEPLMQLSTEDGLAEFHHQIREYKPEVLFLDPINRMIVGWNENSGEHMAKLIYEVDNFAKIGADWGMAVCMSHHFAKAPKNDEGRKGYDALDFNNFVGSMKFAAGPDTIVTVERKQNLHGSREQWCIHTRWETRRGAPPPGDMKFHVNEAGDLYVQYQGLLGGALVPSPKLPPPLPPKEAMTSPPPVKPLTGLAGFRPAPPVPESHKP